MFWLLRGRQSASPNTRSKSPRKPTPESSRAPREILMFRDREVHVLRKPYRRSIGLTLQVNGRIRVSAPKSTPLSRIEDFLAANTQWIETHLQKYRELRDTYPPKRYVEGETFQFLGEKLKLSFVKSARSRVRIEARDGALFVEVPQEAWAQGFDPSQPHPQLALAMADFYAREGRAVIGQRLAIYSERMGLMPSAVSFRSQKTRWGSCSSRGKISLNWRLIVAPLEVIDYVVVHELSHLRFYNHSQSFWDLVGTQLPRYAELRQWLRDHQYEADFLAKSSELHA